jgi:dienelactone hydrolase
MLLSDLHWSLLSDIRNISDPSQLVDSVPRLAREESYAKTNIDAWKKDFEDETTSRQKIESFGSEFIYKRSSDGVNLYGYIVIPSSVESKLKVSDKVPSIPAIILFHTGAGPQDIFMKYQADKLVREKIWGEEGCIVFIADIISDQIGWAWQDRNKYWEARKSLLEITDKDGQNKRWLLRDTVRATLEAVKSIDMVDVGRIGAFGYCLGGQPIFELGMMQSTGLKGLISFHGLYDNIYGPDCDELKHDSKRRVLICNGSADPYVPISDVQRAAEIFKKCGWMVDIINYENVFHNFSNPRKDYDDIGMGYDEYAATNSWSLAVELLRDVFEM